MNQFYLLSTIISGGNKAAESGGGGLFSNPLVMIVIYMAVIFGIIWFMGRPDKKKQAALEKQLNSIQPGTDVVLKSGVYGTIKDVTAECFIVEFGINKGVQIPVMKEAVADLRSPNLTNTPTPKPVKEKRGLFGTKKKEDNK